MDTMFLYGLYDKVGKTFISFNESRNNQTYIRSNFKSVYSMYPLKDVDIVKVAKIDCTTGDVIPVKHEVVSWSDYKFPETKAENLAPLGKDAVEAFNDATKDVKEVTK